jgi:hypothetical protein
MKISQLCVTVVVVSVFKTTVWSQKSESWAIDLIEKGKQYNLQNAAMAPEEMRVYWQTHPRESLDAITNTIKRVASASRTNELAKNSLRDMFIDIARLPSVEKEDVISLDQQIRVIEYFWLVPETCDDETNLLTFASALGRIRRGIIPDFKYDLLYKRDVSVVDNMNGRGIAFMNGRDISLPKHEGQIEKEQFQARLALANQKVTTMFKMTLLYGFGQQRSAEKKRDLFKKMIPLAEMTEEEIRGYCKGMAMEADQFLTDPAK